MPLNDTPSTARTTPSSVANGTFRSSTLSQLSRTRGSMTAYDMSTTTLETTTNVAARSTVAMTIGGERQADREPVDRAAPPRGGGSAQHQPDRQIRDRASEDDSQRDRQALLDDRQHRQVVAERHAQARRRAGDVVRAGTDRPLAGRSRAGAAHRYPGRPTQASTRLNFPYNGLGNECRRGGIPTLTYLVTIGAHTVPESRPPRRLAMPADTA
jgi:hypothetical protein